MIQYILPLKSLWHILAPKMLTNQVTVRGDNLIKLPNGCYHPQGWGCAQEEEITVGVLEEMGLCLDGECDLYR